nr:tetratricopeptide repeat protein [Prochlorococcus sp. MIT 1300]
MMQNSLTLKAIFNRLAILIISLTGCLSARPVSALIPYVYEPNPQVLYQTSLNIGRTATQLLQIGQNEQAANLAALAVRLQPHDERLWSVLAAAQHRNGQLEAALRSLIKAKTINPQNPEVWFAEAALILEQNQPNQAIKLLNHGLKLDPKNSNGYFQLGNARIMQANFESALKAFKQACSLKPSFWEALNNQAIVLFEMGKMQKAIQTWREVLIIEKNAEPMLALAAALNQIQPQASEAINLANKALSQNPNYVLAKYQEEQLWGFKLRKAARELLQKPELFSAVDLAEANAD